MSSGLKTKCEGDTDSRHWLTTVFRFDSIDCKCTVSAIRGLSFDFASNAFGFGYRWDESQLNENETAIKRMASIS